MIAVIILVRMWIIVLHVSCQLMTGEVIFMRDDTKDTIESLNFFPFQCQQPCGKQENVTILQACSCHGDF